MFALTLMNVGAFCYQGGSIFASPGKMFNKFIALIEALISTNCDFLQENECPHGNF